MNTGNASVVSEPGKRRFYRNPLYCVFDHLLHTLAKIAIATIGSAVAAKIDFNTMGNDMSMRITSTLILMASFVGSFGQKVEFKVAVFLYEEVEVLDFAGPTEVFAATDGFEVYTVSVDGQLLSTRPDGVVKVKPDYSLENAPKPDIMIFPGGNSGNPTANSEKLFQWIRDQKAEGALVMTICSGANLVAKTGLLDGLNISTNYQIVERMSRDFPKIKVLDDARFVDNGYILTTAGVSAGIDGALHLIRRIKGSEVADATAKYMEYDKWNPDDGRIDYVNGNIKRIAAGMATDGSEPIPFEGELMNEATLQFKKGNYKEASNLLEASVGWYPSSFHSWQHLSAVYKAQGKDVPIDESDFLTMLDHKDFLTARRVYEEMVGKFPGWLFFSEQSIYDSGHQYMNEGDFTSALEVFKIYVQAFPKSWYSFDSLASTWKKLGNREQAINNYQKVLELNPENEDAKKALVDLKR
ncbi:MAG TPA: DJ-1/PfpI family protein [Cyclobacteriaceae bacterium]|nr:DJ-1/PfpI family protein [Cyclobacteriaceae bacterium]